MPLFAVDFSDTSAASGSQPAPSALAPRIGDVLRDQVAEAQPFVQLPHEDEPAIGGDARSLELDPQRGIEGELKWPVLRLTHWVRTLHASSSRGNPYQQRLSTHPRTSIVRVEKFTFSMRSRSASEIRRPESAKSAIRARFLRPSNVWRHA